MNWQTFRTRALTAVIFVVVMLAGLLWNRWSFFALATLVHFGAWVEYQRLLLKINPDYQRTGMLHRYGIMLAGWMLMLFLTDGSLYIGEISLTDVGFYGGIGLFLLMPLVMLFEHKNPLLKNIGQSFGGVMYISLPLALFVNLRMHWSIPGQPNLVLPLLVIVTIWVNDTMAYVVGSFIGKTPFSPISPKKTWEGTIGGVVLTIVAVALTAALTGLLRWQDAAAMSALGAVAGTYGDLFESKLKRMAGVKDSGSIMPGHGGFLDRFDSLLFAATVIWIYASFRF